MARQQYNNRSINSYHKSSRHIISGHRHLPPVRYSDPPREDRIQDVLIHWVLTDLDPWYYKAMKFEPTDRNSLLVCYRVEVSASEQSSYSSNNLGVIMFKEGEVVIVPFGSCSLRPGGCWPRRIGDIADDTNSIPYADPNMMELLERAIKLLYNSHA